MDLDMNNKNLKDEFENLNKDDPDFSKKCSKLIKDINEGLCTILQLTEQLKGLLVDPVPVNREIGVHVLTMVLEEISHERISVAQINVMCDFYADKLKDHHQIIPATLRGILALLSFNNVPDGQLRKLLDSLFKNVPCQQQQQHDRLNIYKILKKSLENSAAELLEMDMDFVYGVMSAVDGERDPRNLLFLFHWLPIFLRQCNLGHLREEMFEVLACYFPIDFRTPPQDSNSISRSTLASSLSDCLCATPDFAEYCLPLALEKLSSSLHIAKFDSLDILVGERL
uniref:MMS19 nucleotide excision repair protein n=1 Tax=Photinus pyralis TaxID=7054 RepID=A0A1Y1KNK2_PHOPY